MTIYLAASELDLWNQIAGIVGTETNASFRDASLTPSAVMKFDSGDVAEASFTALSSLWFHHYADQNSPNVTGEVVKFRSGGTDILRLYYTGSVTRFEYWNTSTWIDIPIEPSLGATLRAYLNGRSLAYWDFEITIHATTGRFAFYHDRTLLCLFEGDTTSAGVTDTDTIRLGGARSIQNRYASQMIVADESTLGWREQTFYPNAAGPDTGFAGTFADIDDVMKIDAGTFISSDTAAQASSFELAANAMPVGFEIKAVSFQITASRGSTGPQNLDVSIESNAVLDTLNITDLELGLKTYNHIIEIDPNTSIEWTPGAIDAMRIQVDSVA